MARCVRCNGAMRFDPMTARWECLLEKEDVDWKNAIELYKKRNPPNLKGLKFGKYNNRMMP
jgi:hypothetical protein